MYEALEDEIGDGYANTVKIIDDKGKECFYYTSRFIPDADGRIGRLEANLDIISRKVDDILLRLTNLSNRF